MSSENGTAAKSRPRAWSVYAVGCIGGILAFFCARKFPLSPNLKDVLVTVSAVSGLLAGFMLTSAAILASIGDRPFIRIVRRQGVYGRLIVALFASVRWCIVSSAASIPGILYVPDWHLAWYPFAIGGYTTVFLITLLLCWRCLALFSVLMQIIASEVV